MKKRIVIFADGTWNRPEKDLDKDTPTNVLRLARAIKPRGTDPVSHEEVAQHVFYDWGIGSYHDEVIGGATGRGIEKNIMDCYRYIVQNYSPGDEIYLFGFSRGAYTVRCVSGMINNSGILKRPKAALIQKAFELYKKSGPANKPTGVKATAFRQAHAHASRRVTFVGVWDTVGALGIPISFLGLLDKRDEFFDTEIGSNVDIARQALAIDEKRSDFEPTVWVPKSGLDLKQVWFAGCHSDIGGGNQADRNGLLLADIPLKWMMSEARQAGLQLEPHLAQSLRPAASAKINESRRHIYRSRGKLYRPIEHGPDEQGRADVVRIHRSVRERWDHDSKYRPKNLKEYLAKHGWPAPLEA
jgi:uncharacterized protein (DUF2235 family)